MNSSDDNIYARWISGNMTPEEIDKLRATGELAELESIINTVDEFALPPLDSERLYTNIKNQVEEKSSIVPMFRWMARAAALMVGGAIIYMISQAGSGLAEVNASYGDTASIVLPDASIIILNDGSTISYDTREYIDERMINLVGEASFKVTEGKSFRVKTDNGLVEVLGTEFNIRAWDGTYRVECYEGSVRVSSQGQEVILVAQEVAILNDGSLSQQSIEHKAPFWSQGLSRFEQASLDAVLNELERQYDISIEYSGGNKTFSGAFIDSDLETALRSICLPLGLTFQFDQNSGLVIIE